MTTEIKEKVEARVNKSYSIKSITDKETLINNIMKVLYTFEQADPKLFEKYMIAPSSTRYHGVYAGGLFDHSMNVCVSMAEWLVQHQNAGLTFEDCAIVGLLHDTCKAELYILDENTGKYSYDKNLVVHHAKGSLDIIRKRLNIKLSTKQRVLILLHMSSWHNDEDVKALNLLDRCWLIGTKHIRLLQVVNWADMKAVQDEAISELKK